MVRTLAVLLAALPLAGCLHESYGLEVSNRGGREARLTVVYDEWVADEDGEGRWETRVDGFVLSPGETVTPWYSDAPIHVRIERIVDGTVLYEEWLSDGDFESEHGRVEIDVYP